MLAQNTTKDKRDSGNSSDSVEWHLPEAHLQLEALEQWIHQSAQDGSTAHTLERGLFQRVLELGATLSGPS